MSKVTEGHPMWCRVYARKTPAIPTHNGLNRCLGCGVNVAAILVQQQAARVAAARAYIDANDYV